MKKRLCVILIAAFAALMVFAFAGCSSSSDSDETSSTDQEEQATTNDSSSTAEEESDDKASDDKESDEKDSDDKESDDKDSKKSDKEPSGEELLLATGGEEGTYYAFGTVIAQYADDSFDLPVSALSSEGSQANIDSLENGDVDLAFCQNDVATNAYEGENLYDGKKIDNFSVVAAMYEEQVQIVTTDESIKDVSDLEGKSVSLGAEDSGVLQNALDILDVYGLTEDDVDAVYQDFTASTESLKDGEIDAAFVVAGAPTTAVTDLADSTDVYLVSMDEEHVSDAMEKSPYYTEATIEADTYTNQDEDVQTIGVLALILAADTVSDDDVYVFTESLFDGAEEQADAHDKYKELGVDDAASITDIPYHPGAAEYYKDQGITVESKADSKDSSKDSEASEDSEDSKDSSKDSEASEASEDSSKDSEASASDEDEEDDESSENSRDSR